jgi:hypothetical protein
MTNFNINLTPQLITFLSGDVYPACAPYAVYGVLGQIDIGIVSSPPDGFKSL